MKKVLEMIAVTVVVLSLICTCVSLSRGHGSDAPAAPGGAEDESPVTTILEGAP